jgi:hypothetical protein
MTRLNTNQRAAIEAVLRQFADQALARGMPPWQRDPCDACAAMKPKAGFVNYEEFHLCNDCALQFEIKRAEREVTSVRAFVTAKAMKTARRN